MCVCIATCVSIISLWVSARLCILKPHFRTSQNFLFLYVLTVAFVCSFSDITAMCRNSVSVLCTSGSVDNITFHVVYWTLTIYSNMFAPLFSCRHVLHIIQWQQTHRAEWRGSESFITDCCVVTRTAFSALTLLACRKKQHPAYKKLVMRCWLWLRWYGHVLRKDDDDWVKKCMEYEVQGSRPRGRPGKRLSERTVKHVS